MLRPDGQGKVVFVQRLGEGEGVTQGVTTSFPSVGIPRAKVPK